MAPVLKYVGPDLCRRPDEVPKRGTRLKFLILSHTSAERCRARPMTLLRVATAPWPTQHRYNCEIVLHPAYISPGEAPSGRRRTGQPSGRLDVVHAPWTLYHFRLMPFPILVRACRRCGIGCGRCRHKLKHSLLGIGNRVIQICSANDWSELDNGRSDAWEAIGGGDTFLRRAWHYWLDFPCSY